ncbi:MAG TPA: biotin carboxylase N-terminal domain-containing protein [Solirubrobacteraceae bacterium]
MFGSVLIANRGEIALRIARTLRRMEIESIAVFSDADAGAPHVLAADRAIHIGPTAAAHSYLDVEKIVQAAITSGAEAIHPGYGFLSERSDFAQACIDAGLTFIGPSPEAIALLGDKAAAKQAAIAAGVPVVPGLSFAGLSAAHGAERADSAERAGGAERELSDAQIGEWVAGQELPVLLKAAGGGGGRGMRVVHSLDELPDQLAAARREAQAAFGDARLIVERYIEHARHIEVQVIADAHGKVLHLGERECSLQRRHQKVIEEAPSPVVDAELRAKMGAAAVALAQSCGYTGAGTVELIAERDAPERFHFLEMNARLQVEHPVTEAVTGLDLVELQLRIAAGQPLQMTQDEVQLNGHAIEARIYAEDPGNGFLPSSGRVIAYREPYEAWAGGQATPSRGPLRIDSGVAAGGEVGTAYDPMLAKLIAHAPDRGGALRTLTRGLAETLVLGPTTNIAWLQALLTRPEVQAGALDTTLIERLGPELAPTPADENRLTAGLALVALVGQPCSEDPWDARDGWQLQGATPATMRLETAHGETVTAQAMPDGSGGWQAAGASVRLLGDALQVQREDGSAACVEVHRDGEAVWLFDRSSPNPIPVRYAPARALATRHAAGGSLQAPMPGVVLEVRTSAGAEISAGQLLIVLESMKMELSVASPRDGVVEHVHVATGERVSEGQPLLELRQEVDPADTGTTSSGDTERNPAQPTRRVGPPPKEEP